MMNDVLMRQEKVQENPSYSIFLKSLNNITANYFSFLNLFFAMRHQNNPFPSKCSKNSQKLSLMKRFFNFLP
jgi:hypothetical protein